MLKQDIFQDIILNLKTLSEDKVLEVSDFVSFLKSKDKICSSDIFILSQLDALGSDWEASGMELYDEL